jgi:hypothetical protein
MPKEPSSHPKAMKLLLLEKPKSVTVTPFWHTSKEEISAPSEALNNLRQLSFYPHEAIKLLL